MATVVKFNSKEMARKLKQAKRFKPLHEWILLCREDPQVKTFGGIIIPETSVANRKMLGVIAATSKKHLINYKFKFTVGDRVMFAPLSGIEIKIEGDEYYLIKSSEIIALIS